MTQKYTLRAMVNNQQVKGLIVTAETLLDFRRLLRDGMFGEGERKKGAEHIIKSLEDFYNRI